MTLGGGTTTGLKFTEEQKEKCRKRMLEHNPFKVETGLLGQLEIGAGKIKMDIPMVNKSLVLNQQDLNELKDMLSHQKSEDIKEWYFFISFLSFFIIQIIIKWEHYQITPKLEIKVKI